MNEQQRQEISGDELFKEIDLFENTQFMNYFIKRVYERWEEKIKNGLEYADCEKFLNECENIGFTFQYELDANPFYLVPIKKDDQLELLNEINKDKEARVLSSELLAPLSYLETTLLQQYARVKRENFDNFFADYSKSVEYDNYEELKSKYDVATIHKIENLYKENVYEQNGGESQIQVDLFLRVVNDIKKENLLYLLPNEIDGVKISEWQKEHLINNGVVAVTSPEHDDELQVRFYLQKEGNINAAYPSGEENIIKLEDLISKQNKIENDSLKIGNLAVYNKENTFFKGQIDLVSGDTVTLKNLLGESANFHKDQIYQFFPGQKYDRSEIETLFKVEPAGIKFSNLDKSDITKLMKGELTNTLFNGYTVKDGEKLEYSFKMRPEYSKTQGKLTLKPYWKNKFDEMPLAAFGANLTKEQIREASEGKSIIVEGLSKEQKPFTVKAHYDKELNSFIADKFVNKNDLKKEESFKNDLAQKSKGQKI